MAKVCEVCGKGPLTGNTYVRRGNPKKEGGIGLNILGKTRRRFLPNLHKVRAIVKDKIVTIRSCSKCLKAGKVTRA